MFVHAHRLLPREVFSSLRCHSSNYLKGDAFLAKEGEWQAAFWLVRHTAIHVLMITCQVVETGQGGFMLATYVTSQSYFLLALISIVLFCLLI